MHTDVTVERNWLMQMGHGAAVNDINILYCMSYSRHMLQEKFITFIA